MVTFKFLVIYAIHVGTYINVHYRDSISDDFKYLKNK